MNEISKNTGDLLSIPSDVGRAIIEAGAAIACPLLGTNTFVKFCTDRDITLNRERLIRLERLGLFAPVFRVTEPDEDVEALSIPPKYNNNWFEPIFPR